MTDHFHLAVPVQPTDHVRGPHTARVAVVEYGDFECPDCRRVYPATELLVQHFGNRIAFVYRHFPLIEVHPHAELAAEVSEIAAAQGKFWEMHAKLFEHPAQLDEKHLHGFARDIGLDMARYQAELDDHVYLQRVQEHVAGGKRSGVRGTPTFYLNGALLDASAGMEPVMKHIQAAVDRL
ncbi:MAG TPA: DsbA family protein [Gammaproteobacteria bacterium]|jgi:protein-disulfide isomerase|nr:DsbA family protein [Gammaproteobacteria bacterium]